LAADKHSSAVYEAVASRSLPLKDTAKIPSRMMSGTRRLTGGFLLKMSVRDIHSIRGARYAGCH
jgi:hypothetical protein